MDEAAKKFAELAQQYGPHVVEAAKQAAQVGAFSTLASSVIPFLLGIGFLILGRWLWRKEKEWDAEGLAGAFAVTAFCATAVCSAIFLWSWIDPWTWIAIYHPDLWIAKRILKL